MHDIDLSPAMVAVARNRLGPAADIQLADAERPPLPDGAVEAVVCVDSLHHQPHPEVALTEMRRVLVSGGHLIIAD